MSNGETIDQSRYDTTSIAIRNMFSSVAKRYDVANRVMSLGRDIFWRKALARRVKILTSPGHLLDLAAGTGDQIVAAKHAHPDLKITGLDLSQAMLDLAEPKLSKLPPPHPEIIVGNALEMPFEDESFDSVSISFGLRNIKARTSLYQEALRVLKPGGRFLVLEMFHDRNSRWTPVIDFYLNKIVPIIGGRLVSQEREAYRYLAASIMAFPAPQRLAEELSAAGFTALQGQVYTFNTVMLLWGEKPTI